MVQLTDQVPSEAWMDQRQQHEVKVIIQCVLHHGRQLRKALELHSYNQWGGVGLVLFQIVVLVLLHPHPCLLGRVAHWGAGSGN